MNIGILDADLLDKGTRHPNLALMKISNYEKSLSSNVFLLEDYKNIQKYDTVYLSKVFDYTKIPINIKEYPNIISGGTGLYWDKSPKLDWEIEHSMPDYHLYDTYIQKEIARGIKKSYFLDYMDYSIGFATRGCFRMCPFCVNHNDKKVVKHSPIKEFYNTEKKFIYLWDDNFLGYSKWQDVLDELEEIQKPFQFRQGLDIRLLTDEKAKRLTNMKYKGDFIFAFDDISEKDIIVEKINQWKKYYLKKNNIKLYIFCGYDRKNKYDKEFWDQDIVDVMERIKILMQLGCIPYIMRHENYKQSPHAGMYITLARWCNQPSFFKKESLKEYVYITDGIGREHKQYAAKRYLEEYQKKFPDIAKRYFDLKFEDLKQF